MEGGPGYRGEGGSGGGGQEEGEDGEIGMHFWFRFGLRGVFLSFLYECL